MTSSRQTAARFHAIFIPLYLYCTKLAELHQFLILCYYCNTLFLPNNLQAQGFKCTKSAIKHEKAAAGGRQK